MLPSPAGFVAALSGFVLEILPWGLSGLIVLYLLWSACFAPASVTGAKPLAEQSLRLAPAGSGPTARVSANFPVNVSM
jgi:hypothetical protein